MSRQKQVVMQDGGTSPIRDDKLASHPKKPDLPLDIRRSERTTGDHQHDLVPIRLRDLLQRFLDKREIDRFLKRQEPDTAPTSTPPNSQIVSKSTPEYGEQQPRVSGEKFQHEPCPINPQTQHPSSRFLVQEETMIWHCPDSSTCQLLVNREQPTHRGMSKHETVDLDRMFQPFPSKREPRRQFGHQLRKQKRSMVGDTIQSRRMKA
jgi:hypothetical protein